MNQQNIDMKGKLKNLYSRLLISILLVALLVMLTNWLNQIYFSNHNINTHQNCVNIQSLQNIYNQHSSKWSEVDTVHGRHNLTISKELERLFQELDSIRFFSSISLQSRDTEYLYPGFLKSERSVSSLYELIEDLNQSKYSIKQILGQMDSLLVTNPDKNISAPKIKDKSKDLGKLLLNAELV
ncbi:hypothetical protein, partial [Robertkochia marina]